MTELWWQDVTTFVRDLRPASDERLSEMYDWAALREADCDRPGRGRNPKARRMYRLMKDAAAERLDERGLLWP